MSRLKKWFLILLGLAVLAAAGSLVLAFFLTDFIVDLWWFRSLGYEGFFWLRLTYRHLILAGFTFIFFTIFFLNFWLGSRYLGTTTPPLANDQARSRYRKLVHNFRTGSLKFYAPFSLILAVLVAWPLYQNWEEALLYIFGPAAGWQDPYFGQDISYYLLSLPVYEKFVNELLLAVALLLAALLLLYWIESRVLARQEQTMPMGARIHLNLLVFLLIILAAWRFWLERYQLLSGTRHAPLFSGPGFVEMYYVLPLLYLTVAALILTGLAVVYYLATRKGVKLLVASLVLLAVGVGLRYWQAPVQVLEKYIVKPNEISRERPFIAKNIAATLRAYNLHRVETREYELALEDWETRALRLRQDAGLRNIPVWDREVLRDVFKQLQELRTYYEFTAISVDRYQVNDLKQQVFLSPREIEFKDLPPEARGWINERLKYTHGYGVVMVPAAQGGDEPLTWFIYGIPPTSDYGFQIEQPAIYYGKASYGPAIAPNDSGEMGYPVGDTNTVAHYAGRGDVRIHNLFRKLIFALYFKEKDIFFTTKTNRDSRILFRRNIVERIKAITPFLRLDNDPYIVVTSRGLFWLQDAYTVSNRYPGSQTFQGQFNYIRNSLKIVVDAYNGTVAYYLADPEDPISRAWQRAYPGLIKAFAEIPADLRPHIRYPKDMFDIQLQIYNKYHQTEEEEFYKQEDLWEFPTVEQEKKSVRLGAQYLTLNIIDPDRSDFVLLAALTPRARANLRALVVAGCDGPNYGRIIVYSFPKGSLVYGPSQVNALINQDTEISQQFTLWDQVGSQVERGRMVILPLAGSILYIQPVYLKAAGRLKIPQLKRLIVSKDSVVVMEPSLEEGLLRLTTRLKALGERARQRLPAPPAAELPPGPPSPPPPLE